MNVEKNKKGGATGKAVIPENFQKKQKRDQTHREELTKTRANRKAEGKKRREEITKRAEGYVKAHRERLLELVKKRREARASGSYFVPAEGRLLLAVRIRGVNRLAPRVKRILRLFRLRQIHNAAFIRVNKATLNMLKHIDPYVTYGYPDRKTISQLLYKRGYMKVKGQRLPIVSNQIIESVLGKQNILSIEDLIEEITNIGANFKVANNSIWPFKLNSPKGGYREKRHPYNQGGDWGNREQAINEFVRRMI
jgi:large subunit ribosomal protein L7e